MALAYETGDLLTAEVDIFPFITHKGLVVVDNEIPYVWHNTPVKKNGYGGSVIKEPLAEWLSTRKVTAVEKTNLDKEHIEGMSLSMKEKAFDLLDFNCEHFVYIIKDNEHKSPQLKFWGTVGLSVISTMLILQAIKK
jgi:hypothetical protein